MHQLYLVARLSFYLEIQLNHEQDFLMIRSRRLPLGLLNAWLVDQNLASGHPRYRLRVWREDRAELPAIQADLIEYIDEAFKDARDRIRRGFEDNLSPFDDPADDPAANYPALLHRVTLQGYWGEILAALAVEHWGAHNHRDWVIPAFLFRFHVVEFQHLETINERLGAGEAYDPDQNAQMRPGRTGDDGLAFRINDRNVITDILTLEAKCLSQNNNATIEEAHQKLASGGVRPSGVRELVNLLEDYNEPIAQAWQKALYEFWRTGYQIAIRYDGVAYTCGHTPVRPPDRIAWLPHDAPHRAYTVDRNLEAMEFQFEDLNTVINTLFRRA